MISAAFLQLAIGGRMSGLMPLYHFVVPLEPLGPTRWLARRKTPCCEPNPEFATAQWSAN